MRWTRRPPRALALAAVLCVVGSGGGLDAQQRPTDDRPALTFDARGPFAVGTDTIEVTGVTWLESWNKNLATDQLVGVRVALGRDWFRGWQGLAEIELQHVLVGRDRDAFLAGISGLVRRRVGHVGSLQPFFELGLGGALSSRPVPPRGTSFNFLLQAGGGAVQPLGPRASVIVGLRLWHLSNGGIIRNQSHNPDIEGLGGYAGLQVHLK